MKKNKKILIILLTIVFMAGCTANADLGEIKNDITTTTPPNISITTPPILETIDPTQEKIFDFKIRDEFEYETIDDLLDSLNKLDFEDQFVTQMDNAGLLIKNENDAMASVRTEDDFYVVKVPQDLKLQPSIFYNILNTAQKLEYEENSFVGSGVVGWFHNDEYNKINIPENIDEAFEDYLLGLTKETETEVRNGVEAIVYTVDNRGYSMKAYAYTLVDEGKTFYIWEQYVASSDVPIKVVTGYPEAVRIIGIDGDKYFRAILGKFNELPTAEWLLEFGVQKYQSGLEME